MIIECQKKINLLDNTPNQPSKFKTKNWVEINDESRRTYNKDHQIRFITSMLRSSLCDYSNAYILVKGTIIVAKERDAAPNNSNKEEIFKHCVPFTIYNVVMSKHKLIEYGNNYSKTSGILWQYCRDAMAVNNTGEIADFPADNVIIN